MALVTCSGDFVISVDGTDISCSKDVLTRESDYFRALFDSKMQECQNNKMTVTDINHETVVALVDCMNTGQLKIEGDVTELAHAAVRFQIPTAIESCESYLLMTLDNTNCFSCLRLAKSLCLETLYSHSKRHVLYYFTSVIEEAEFVSLAIEELVDYLSDRHLNCESEVNILKAIDSWVNCDSDARREYLDTLLACFHGEDLLPSEWDSVLDYPLMLENKSGDEWIKRNEEMKATAVPHHRIEDKKEDRKSGETLNSLDDQGACEWRSARKYRELPHMFLTAGGYTDTTKFCREFCKFDTESRTFKKFKDFHEIFDKVTDRIGFRITTIGKSLYITGGQADLGRTQTHFTDVWKYDSFVDKWMVATTLPSPRRHHGACASRSSLYLMGGFGKYRLKLDTFVEYDTINDEWHKLPNMPAPCIAPHVAFCSNKIFVYEEICVYTYYYDFKSTSWTSVKRNKLTIDFFQVPCVFDNYVYEFLVTAEHNSWMRFTDTEEDSRNQCEFERRSADTETTECFTASNSCIEFGNNVVLVNGRFYTLNYTNHKFVSWDLFYDEKVSLVGTGGMAGKCSSLYAIVSYPNYKLTGSC